MRNAVLLLCKFIVNTAYTSTKPASLISRRWYSPQVVCSRRRPRARSIRLRRRLQGRRKCVSLATAAVAMITGGRRRHQGRHKFGGGRNWRPPRFCDGIYTVRWPRCCCCYGCSGGVVGTRGIVAVVGLVVGAAEVVACGVVWCGRWWVRCP